jgi:taurine dioxygenase
MTVTSRAGKESSSMQIEPLPYALGAYVTGIDLTRLSDAAFVEIHEAWLDHLVIVIREQRLSDGDLIALSARFGVLDEVPPVSIGQKPRDNRHVSVISNILENGVPIGGLGDDEVIWHSDTSYRLPAVSQHSSCARNPIDRRKYGLLTCICARDADTELGDRIDGLSVKNDDVRAGGQLREGLRRSPMCARVGRDASLGAHPSRDAALHCIWAGAATRIELEVADRGAARFTLDTRDAGLSRLAPYVAGRRWRFGTTVAPCITAIRSFYARRVMHRAQALTDCAPRAPHDGAGAACARPALSRHAYRQHRLKMPARRDIDACRNRRTLPCGETSAD